MIGGYDFDSSQFNRALRAVRQPGSAFKPVIYAAAIEAGMNPTTQVSDDPIEREIPGADTWRPKNYDEEFLGPVSLRLALTKSRNLATIDVLEKIGVDAALRLCPPAWHTPRVAVRVVPGLGGCGDDPA